MSNNGELHIKVREMIAELKWLCGHFSRLGPAEIQRRLIETMARQEALLAAIDDSVATRSASTPPDSMLSELCSLQRELLLKVVQTLWFCDSVDCSKLIGSEGITQFVSRSLASRVEFTGKHIGVHGFNRH